MDATPSSHERASCNVRSPSRSTREGVSELNTRTACCCCCCCCRRPPRAQALAPTALPLLIAARNISAFSGSLIPPLSSVSFARLLCVSVSLSLALAPSLSMGFTNSSCVTTLGDLSLTSFSNTCCTLLIALWAPVFDCCVPLVQEWQQKKADREVLEYDLCWSWCVHHSGSYWSQPPLTSFPQAGLFFSLDVYEEEEDMHHSVS